jgi:RNA polymerase sigma factor (sigma-70 family)
MGKKFVDEFILNTIPLEEILKKIKVEENESYYYELLKDLDVIRIINQITNRYSYGQMGFLIGRDVIKGIVEEELMLLTWRDFKIWLCAQDNIKNGYLAFIYKYLGKKVSDVIKNERPGKTLKETNEKIEKKDLIKEDYQYIENLSGNINDLELISNPIQENRWHNTYGSDFEKIADDNKFEELIEELTENQKDILRKTYKKKYTEREIAQDHNVSQVSIHRAKKKSFRRLRKKLGGYQNNEK